MDQYYKLSELANILDIPYISLYREIQDKKLNGVKIRGAWYVSKHDCDLYFFLQTCKTQQWDPEKIIENNSILNLFADIDKEETRKDEEYVL